MSSAPSAGEGGAAAPEVTPRRLHCDVNSTQKIPDLGVVPRRVLCCLNKAGKNTIWLGGSPRPSAEEFKRGWLVATVRRRLMPPLSPDHDDLLGNPVVKQVS